MFDPFRVGEETNPAQSRFTRALSRLRVGAGGSYNFCAEKFSSDVIGVNQIVPIYEYECRKCGARREVMQKLADKPLSKCKECGGRLEKLLSAPAIQFKGSGWYVTDYAGKKGEAKEEGKKSDGKEEKKETAEKASATDKATPKETSSSKKSSKSKPAPSSGD